MAITVPKDGDIISASSFGVPVVTQVNLLSAFALAQSVNAANVALPASASTRSVALTIPATSIPNGRPYWVIWSGGIQPTSATTMDIFFNDSTASWQNQKSLNAGSNTFTFVRAYVGAGVSRLFALETYTWAGVGGTMTQASIFALIFPS